MRRNGVLLEQIYIDWGPGELHRPDSNYGECPTIHGLMYFCALPYKTQFQLHANQGLALMERLRDDCMLYDLI